jgi:DNA replication initiation complex subunit (GINS family)
MLGYNDLYEILRKEKYSETLQLLPKNFVSEFSEYMSDLRERSSRDEDPFAEDLIKSKKQLENGLAMFRELIRIRKRKLLSLVFVATETGLMKRDYENMLSFEKEVFDKLVKAYEEGDKEVVKILNGKKEKNTAGNYKMILFNSDVEQFVDMLGNLVGPFKTGEFANLESDVSDILVSSGKAKLVDEN